MAIVKYDPFTPLKGKAWLDAHLENFVKPYLGVIPKTTDPVANELQTQWFKNLAKEEFLKALLDLWEEAKKRAKGRTMLMPGRDAWTFEILARLEGVKSIFRPDLSGTVSNWACKFDPDRELFKTCYGLDSCCAGSVPRKLGCPEYGLVYQSSFDPTKQLLPHKGGTIEPLPVWASMMESLPKYWNQGCVSGRTDDPSSVVSQTLSNKMLFTGACHEVLRVSDYWFKTHLEGVVMTPKAKAKTVLKKYSKSRRAKVRAMRARDGAIPTFGNQD